MGRGEPNNENHISDNVQTFGAYSENINDTITEDSHKKDTHMHELTERENNIEQSINDSISNIDGSEPPNTCSGDDKQFLTFTNQIIGETMGKIDNVNKCEMSSNNTLENVYNENGPSPTRNQNYSEEIRNKCDDVIDNTEDITDNKIPEESETPKKAKEINEDLEEGECSSDDEEVAAVPEPTQKTEKDNDGKKKDKKHRHRSRSKSRDRHKNKKRKKEKKAPKEEISEEEQKVNC